MRRNSPAIGRDALDPVGPPPAWLQWFPRRHAALGLRPTAVPLLGFVLVGMALGPSGLGVLTAEAIGHLDIAVSIGLTALGVFVGLGLAAIRGTGDVAPTVAAAMLQALLTTAIVGAGMLALLARWNVPLPIESLLLASAAAICASASAATRTPSPDRAARIATQLVDLDDVPLVVLGTFAVCWASGRPVGLALLLTVIAALLTALAGWLLFERARHDAERAVFVTGIILLLGGVAVFTDTSPLLSGCLAALLWARAPGHADRIIAADLRKLQHPFVALVLIVAGALVEWSLALVWMAAPLVLLRLIGKLLGAAAVARVTGVSAGRLSTVLLPPGVLGVALAVNLWQVLGASGALLLSAVAVAMLASEVLAVLIAAGTEPA